MLVTTTLDGPIAKFTETRGLMILVLGETGVEEVKFNDTFGVACVLDIGVLTCGGDTPPANIAEVRV